MKKSQFKKTRKTNKNDNKKRKRKKNRHAGSYFIPEDTSTQEKKQKPYVVFN